MSSFVPFRSRRAAALSFVAAVSAAVPLTHAFGQDAPVQQAASGFGTMAPIVVTPTLFPVPLAEVGSDVTVITAEDIARKQARTLPDALKDVPGLNVVQTGGLGGQSSVFIRGTNSNHTKVLVDGIDISDPSTPNGAFDFSQIPTWDIDRIEVLRGPQSGLYGSDAIGGVVNIVTKTGSGPALFNAMTEGGSFGTFNQAAGVSGSQGRANYNINVVHLRTAALPVTPTDLLGPGEARNDNFASNRTFSAKLGADLTDNFGVNLVSRYTDSLLRFTNDDFNQVQFPNGVPEFTQSRQEEHAFFTRGEGKLLSFDGMLENKFGVAVTHYTRSSVDPITASNTSTNSGDRTKINWQGTARLGNDRTLVTGLEDETDEFASAKTSASIRNRAGFAELHLPILEGLYSTASVRVDDNNVFGRATTWRVAPAYFLAATGTEFRASYGTGFKAPTLSQLFSGTSANPKLQPETSRGFDLGFEQSTFDNALRFGSTYFHDNIHDLIDFGPAPNFQNLNIDSATTYGAENFVALRPATWVELRTDYTYTVATRMPADQFGAGSTLKRRPGHKVSVDATWTPTERWSLTVNVLWVSGWIDATRDVAAQAARATPYTLVNLATEYRVNANATVYGRIDNLLDRRYQEPIGFLQPGLGVFAGVRLTWGGASSGDAN